jgi:hemolysin III
MNPDQQIKALEWFNQTLQDGGPIYTETNPCHLIVEPWNALSSLFIVIPAIIWFIRIRKEYRNYPFLVYCIALMILGGTGSTIFHAFRVSKIFLYLDVLPTAILSLSIGVYFWLKLLKKLWVVSILLFISILLRLIFFRNLPSHTAINVSYAFSGVFVALPLILILINSRGYKMMMVILAIVFFILALIFRETDTYNISLFPMGAHFLWHFFSGTGAYFLLEYLYWFRKTEGSILM